jgi:tetraacyldisaccharide 4'-kinase
VGDEPLLLARSAPTVIARERVDGARVARAAGASVIVLDDGFQNPSLAKDLSLLVIDARRGLGNGLVFPAGPLRAPLKAQLDRAQAVLLIGEGPAASVPRDVGARGLELFRGRLVPEAASIAALKGSRALAFAGIGDPEKFFATLTDAGVDVVTRRGFPDHHRFTAEDAASLLGEADRAGLSLVTTEKDFARLTHKRALAALAARSRVLPVALAIEDEERFRRFVLAGVAASRGR